jgi:hypothetical protein
MANPFFTPAPWEDDDRAVVGTAVNMINVAIDRTTSKQDAAKLMQEQFAPVDVRMHNALRAGHDVGMAAVRYLEGDIKALDILKKGKP